jgi:cyclopropane-fatty-acyl-phospholipid synthase
MVQPPAVIRAFTDQVDVGFDGARSWDLEVHDPSFYGALLRHGSLALGEAYVRGDWDCQALDQLFTCLLSHPASRGVSSGFLRASLLRAGLQRLGEQWINWQSRRRAFAVGRRHYDIAPDVYAAMLDSRRVYSCAYWRQAADLETAQTHKLHLICQKLQLQQGQRLLDVGCGWGGLAAYAARHFGVQVVGITVSAEQARFCRQRYGDLPFEVLLCDYRAPELLEQGAFDRIVSIGMLEHVGRKNDRAYFAVLDRLLRPDGLILIQSIGSHDTNCEIDPWIDTYIFPNGRLPSAQQLSAGFEPWFLLQDWENLGLDYDQTLMAWWRNFDCAWPRLAAGLDDSFYRLWKYYLLSCAGFFRSTQGQLWQLVLSKKGHARAYRSLRPGLCELPDVAAAVPL